MRIRTFLALPAALALAVPAAAHATAAASPALSPTTSSTRAALTTLVTGDQVHLTSTPSGASAATVRPAAPSGPGRVFSIVRTGSDTYAIPAVAQHYLGAHLDPALFDVSAQQRAQATTGRVAVTLHYTGSAKPSVPGVTVSSASGGTASGYLTPASAPAFGKALTAQWKADQKAGFPSRSALFAGSTVTSLAPAAAPGVAKPDFPMYTLTVKVTGVNGKPLTSAFVPILNVDDAAKYNYFADVENGLAKISVPAGHYSAVAASFDYNDTTGVSTVHQAAVNEYKVTGAGQTLTIALKDATVRAGQYSAPHPSTPLAINVTWTRDAKNGSLSSSDLLNGTDVLYVQPQPKPAIGSAGFTEAWQAGGPGSTQDAVKGLTLDLAAYWDHVPSSPKATFTAADLATLPSRYYSDGRTLSSAFGRIPLFITADGGAGAGTFLPFTTPTTRTEYVGSLGGLRATWTETFVVDNDSPDDQGYLDGAWRKIPAGATLPARWNQGPLGAGIPQQDSELGSYCLACSTSTQLELDQTGWLDSDPDHTGELYGDPSGKPVAHFRLTRDGKVIDDQADYLGDVVTVPAGAATYEAVLDVDRRLQQPAQSTSSTTTLGFRATPGQGPGLPSNWGCLAEKLSACHVLPVLQARADLPTSLSGTLPAGPSAFTVTAHRVQGAAASPVTAATFAIRVTGTTAWTTVPLTAKGGGVFAGTVDNTKYAGRKLDVRVTAADAGGSTYAQTVVAAYTVTAA